MLVLSRKVGEKLVIGNDIWVTVVAVNGGRVRIGIDAPEDVCILRAELACCQDEGMDIDEPAEHVSSEMFDRHADEIVRLATASCPSERISGGKDLKTRGFVPAK